MLAGHLFIAATVGAQVVTAIGSFTVLAILHALHTNRLIMLTGGV